MAKWTFTLDLKLFYHNKTLSIQERANRLIVKLDLLSSQVERSKILTSDDKHHYVDRLDDIKVEFEELYGDSNFEKTQSFDNAMEDLYDLGDSVIETDQKYSFFNTPKFCWVKTR